MRGPVLAVIPARSGSKGVVGKNTRLVAGRSLLERAITAAQGANGIDAVVVSTDSQPIADHAEACGVRVASLRPPSLAGDDVPTVLAIQYEVELYERRTSTQIAAVVVVQPTAPLRTSRDIDSTVELLFSSAGTDSVYTAYEGGSVHPRIMSHRGQRSGCTVIAPEPLFGAGDPIRRQEFEPVYVRNGAVYASTRELLSTGRLVGDSVRIMLMPRERSVNIDDEFDLWLADAILNHERHRDR